MNYGFTMALDGSHTFLAHRFDDGDVATRDEPVAIEMPVALIFSGRSFAVMLATPTDLADFACGFALTEGVVEDIDEIDSIEIRRLDRGVEVRVEIPPDRALALDGRRRSLAGRTGCGLCGVDRFSEALRPVAAVAGDAAVTPAALHRAVVDLPRHQLLNARVGSVHAAAFADANGEILLAREDVGRHNALDKLIGALRARSIDTRHGFVLVSSRCSYEMVHKTASAGIALIAAVSAPTSLAVELADKVRVGLAGYARQGRFTIYARPERIATA